MSLISLHQVSSADSTNQLEPPNPSPGTSGNTAGGLGEVAGAIVAPHLWPSSGGVGLQGGDGAAEPCAPPSSCSAWPCCGAADSPTGWNRERLMGLHIGVAGGRSFQGGVQIIRGGAVTAWTPSWSGRGFEGHLERATGRRWCWVGAGGPLVRGC